MKKILFIIVKGHDAGKCSCLDHNITLNNVSNSWWSHTSSRGRDIITGGDLDLLEVSQNLQSLPSSVLSMQATLNITIMLANIILICHNVA